MLPRSLFTRSSSTLVSSNSKARRDLVFSALLHLSWLMINYSGLGLGSENSLCQNKINIKSFICLENSNWKWVNYLVWSSSLVSSISVTFAAIFLLSVSSSSNLGVMRLNKTENTEVCNQCTSESVYSSGLVFDQCATGGGLLPVGWWPVCDLCCFITSGLVTGVWPVCDLWWFIPVSWCLTSAQPVVVCYQWVGVWPVCDLCLLPRYQLVISLHSEVVDLSLGQVEHPFFVSLLTGNLGKSLFSRPQENVRHFTIILSP